MNNRTEKSIRKEKSTQNSSERSIILTCGQEFEECLNFLLENKYAQRQFIFAFSLSQFYN